MKIHWFSPLPPARTEIAHYSVRVAESLAGRAELTFWTAQATWDPAIERLGAVVRYDARQPSPASERSRLQAADATFYHVGNNPDFHQNIVRMASRHAGIVVLHDVALQHLFGAMCREDDPLPYVERMGRYYGAEGARAAEHFLSRGASADALATLYPLTPWALEGALAVVTHTRAAAASATASCSAPVVYAPLPYAAKHQPEAPAREHNGKAEGGRRKDELLHAQTPAKTPPWQLIVFGYLGGNRRLPSVLQALSEVPQREQFRLQIYGELAAREATLAQIRQLGLTRLVTLHGFVADHVLELALAQADLAINLRFPTMGEASASQLRIWDHSLPTLATGVGWYAEQPAGALTLVRPDHEIPDLVQHLTSFALEPARFAAQGRQGRALLEQAHAPANYAQALLNLAEQAERLRVRASTLALAERAGVAAGAWLSPTAPGRLTERITTAIMDIGQSQKAEVRRRKYGTESQRAAAQLTL